MSNDNILKNIHEINLSYLLLAQELIKQDKKVASFRLGVCEDTLNKISKLSLSELIKLGAINQLICLLRLDDEKVINCLTRESRVDELQQVHTGIMLSTQLLRSHKSNSNHALKE
ncbi:flhD [Wigglesworthia glossinidia endosymbiont of Glossina brevipalpis]|uniref:Flagellar transcriptional regulator FlhD n=1 Tax=Wigglesworthia glossinidia brevipalpis TaxID=36870 RepID=FLHD_WIGBR|nr:RecName: Full=Flagellar transcriptional regulator FlhD [Wigglesworthia glossinidia endosymbiont of Glossina brevipalpis]BAC24176.1 flhD [Wigglesworthia glossinidia endosymbiont of Glossina brevipalpis]